MLDISVEWSNHSTLVLYIRKDQVLSDQDLAIWVTSIIILINVFTKHNSALNLLVLRVDNA